MKPRFSSLILAALLAVVLPVFSASAQQGLVYKNGGVDLGHDTGSTIGFHGATPTRQRSGTTQAAVTLTRAAGTLTVAVQPTANDTFTLGATTYTFKASVSTTANQVLIGASLAATQQNIVDAINAATAGSGTEFGSGTVANASATAALGGTANTIVATAILPGTAANSAASTSSFTSGSNSWAASTLTGGAATSADAVGVLVNELRAALVAKGLIKGSN